MSHQVQHAPRCRKSYIFQSRHVFPHGTAPPTWRMDNMQPASHLPSEGLSAAPATQCEVQEYCACHRKWYHTLRAVTPCHFCTSKKIVTLCAGEKTAILAHSRFFLISFFDSFQFYRTQRYNTQDIGNENARYCQDTGKRLVHLSLTQYAQPSLIRAALQVRHRQLTSCLQMGLKVQGVGDINQHLWTLWGWLANTSHGSGSKCMVPFFGINTKKETAP